MAAVDGLCDAGRSLLVMVDIQEKLLAAMSADDRVQITRQGKLLLIAAERLEVPVLVTEQYPRGLGPTAPELKSSVPAAARWFDKTRFSCCGADHFTDALPEDRKQTILFGMEAHVCVLQTGMELLDRGCQVFVVEDTVCSRKQANKTKGLQRLRDAGAIITNSESVLFEWLRDARHEHFRELTAGLKN